jgi:hypothetical protein
MATRVFEPAIELKQAALAFMLIALLVPGCPPAGAKRAPFSGSWISIQYTNGKEFLLRLEQVDHDLIGWEGKLPPNIDNLPPDLKGTIKGKIADVQVSHRRGYQAHAQLRLQGSKLVWQLMECDNRSSRYFPLASTLNREAGVPSAAYPDSAKSAEQPIWDILARSESFDTETAGGQSPEASPYFSAYKALLARNLKPDDTSLLSLLKSKSSAGRLYAAAILWELSRNDGLNAFKSLTGDNAPVRYKSGGTVSPTTVSEIARSFSENGGYMDFPSKRYASE